MQTKSATIMELLPPFPEEGFSIESPALLTVADLNVQPFFEARGNTFVGLRPEVIKYFPQLLPILKWIAESVKVAIEKQNEGELALSIDQLIRTLNERIPAALASIVLKSRYTNRPHLLALFEGKDIPDDEHMRDMARAAIRTAFRLKVVPTQRRVAHFCNINPGQFSNFIRTGSALGMEKVIESFDYVVTQAVEAGRLEEFRKCIFNVEA